MDEVIIYAPWFTPRTKAPMNYRRLPVMKAPEEGSTASPVASGPGPRRVNSGPLASA